MWQDFKDTTIVVTGAAGFIGSHLCQSLLGQGATVVGVDNFITGSQQTIEELASFSNNFSFIEADVSHPADTYLQNLDQLDLILHFASPASPPLYQKFPVETYSVNAFGTHHLLQFLQKNHQTARFLLASTSEVYGSPAEHPQKEGYWGNVNPNGLRSCYDESKRLAETICGVYERDFGLDVRIVRIFNTYGPRMDINDGRVIPNFMKAALTGAPYPIYGDGSQTRSYCFVADEVAGILELARRPDLSGETINIGNPQELTIIETALAIERVLKQDHNLQVDDLEIKVHPLPSDDPNRRQPDITKAQQLLGWQPQTSLEDGLSQTLNYFKSKM